MNMGGNDEMEAEKRNEDALNFHSGNNMPFGWQLNCANNASLGVITNSNPMMTNSFWDQPLNSVNLGLGMFLPTSPRMLPQSLPQLQADSDFIERAARFSCFNGGNSSDLINPFKTTESMTNVAESSIPIDGPAEGSQIKNDYKNESTFEAKQRDEGFGNECDGPECSGRGDQEASEGALESSGKELVSKKRKRSGQLDKNKRTPPRLDEGSKDQTEIQQDRDKNGKEEYIHVRARRGQATNSHSLAERVRREKISQRMKFLQDLVPGCNKVTGKAVMLDEIINYVQSLQRQVEFLSMKLATVNPRLDFYTDGLIAKDILQSQNGPSSSLTYPPNITMPYPAQLALLQSVLPGYGNSMNALQRTNNSEKATMTLPNVWDNELHTLFQMGFKPNAPLNIQDHSSLPTAQTNSES